MLFFYCFQNHLLFATFILLVNSIKKCKNLYKKIKTPFYIHFLYFFAMIYGYCRCSTNETKQDILRQERELLKQGVKAENIFTEYAHGTDKNRIELQRLFNIISHGDTIISTELSRITRSVKELIQILEIAKTKHLKLIFGSFVCDCSAEILDPMTEGMLKMMAVFAEMERNIISQRVKSGMQNAKAKGKKIGRPTTTKTNIPDKFWKYFAMYKDKNISISAFARIMNCARTTIYKYIKIAEQ